MKRMKNKWAWICLAVVCLIIVIYFVTTERPSSEPETMTIDYEFHHLTYNELKKEADVIARVKAEDELTEESSFEIVSRNSGDTVGVFAERTCSVIEYYKDETGEKLKELTIIEPAGVIDGVINHMGGYMCLDKGVEYVLFLDIDRTTGNKYIISGNNGMVRIEGSNWENPEFPEIAEGITGDSLKTDNVNLGK